MLPKLVVRTLRSANKRCIAKFLWNFGVKGMRSEAQRGLRPSGCCQSPKDAAHFSHEHA